MASGYTPGLMRSMQEPTQDRNNTKRNKPFPHPGAQIQNAKAARVYVFGDGNIVDDDEDEVTEFEMRSRHKAVFSAVKEEPRPVYFEKEISEGDTLQAIALKYACNVSELKRLNNLIQDQEFFALKVVKVPMKRYGILSELVASDELQSAHTASASKTCNGSISDIGNEDRGEMYSEGESSHDFSDPETQMKVLRTLSIRENFSTQGKEAEKFLNKMDADLVRLKSQHRSERESLTEVISVLTNKSIHPLSISKKSRYNGADCGINWWSILIFTLAIAIVGPILFLLYYFVIKS